MSGSYDLCSTAGLVLESEAVEVILSAGEPLALVNIELVICCFRPSRFRRSHTSSAPSLYHRSPPRPTAMGWPWLRHHRQQ